MKKKVLAVEAVPIRDVVRTVMTSFETARGRVKRKRVQLVFDSSNLDSVSKTIQDHTPYCDINQVVANAQRGILPNLRSDAKYGDFTQVEDFITMRTKIVEANEQFMELPADVRSFFKNDVANLVEYIADPKNFDSAVEMGVVPKPKGWVKPEPKAEPKPPVVDPSLSKAEGEGDTGK